eukprot:TRINITY_DN70753_c0_g1_i1.p1 TRINITY_DN70753_c0_g1~~TRINITY_DN70753_c0_g1_i1.p1  ORF type:complete len:371 (+),score=52.72 TRINITY_DN70753_c0_g1_i1:163-1275(+)
MTPAVVPRLVGLLAAHFPSTDYGRVERLRRLLRSVEMQTHRVPLLVSWSAEDGANPTRSRSVASQVETTLREFGDRGVLRAMPPILGRRGQFEHYSRLNDALSRHVDSRGGLGSEPRTMVMFTDDDDIWHSRRAEAYLEAAVERPDAEVLASRVHASPGLSPRLPPSATQEDVSQMLANDQLRLSVNDATLQPGLFGTAAGEYFDVAIAVCVLAAFFRRHNRALLANTFADIRFRTFMHKWPGGVYRFLPHKADGAAEGPGEAEAAGRAQWMYHYDRPLEPYTTLPGDEDIQYVCDQLPDVYRIAGMRQTLDCVLFQLAPTQGPLRITKRDFADQLVGILQDQGPAAVAMALHRCQIHGIQVADVDEDLV